MTQISFFCYSDSRAAVMTNPNVLDWIKVEIEREVRERRERERGKERGEGGGRERK